MGGKGMTCGFCGGDMATKEWRQFSCCKKCQRQDFIQLCTERIEDPSVPLYERRVCRVQRQMAQDGELNDKAIYYWYNKLLGAKPRKPGRVRDRTPQQESEDQDDE